MKLISSFLCDSQLVYRFAHVSLVAFGTDTKHSIFAGSWQRVAQRTLSADLCEVFAIANL